MIYKQHKINNFKLTNSMTFNVLTMLGHHHGHRSPDTPTAKGNPPHSAVALCSPPSQPLATTGVCSVSTHLPILGILCEWNQTIGDFFCLASST